MCYAEHALAKSGAIDPVELAKVRAMIRGYYARWELEDYRSDCRPEQAFSAPTGVDGVNVGGKLDVLHKPQQRRFTEHKTSSENISDGSVYWRRLTLDSQVGNYFRGAKSLGSDVTECVYDVIKKPGAGDLKDIPQRDADGVKIVHDSNGARVRTKNGKKWRETADKELGYVLQTRLETIEEYEARLVDEIAAEPDAYYRRATIVRLEAEVDEYENDLTYYATAIKEAQHRLHAPRNPDACVFKGRVCSYFDVCCGTARLDDPSLYRLAKRRHEELPADIEGNQ
jgi:hypothetical protein